MTQITLETLLERSGELQTVGRDRREPDHFEKAIARNGGLNNAVLNQAGWYNYLINKAIEFMGYDDLYAEERKYVAHEIRTILPHYLKLEAMAGRVRRDEPVEESQKEKTEVAENKTELIEEKKED